MNLKVIVSFAAGAAVALAMSSIAQPSHSNAAACEIELSMSLDKLDKDVREHATAEDNQLRRMDHEIFDVMTASQRSASILEVMMMPRH